MYKGASDKAQGRASRVLPKDVAGYNEKLSLQERLKMLREEVQRVDALILQTPKDSRERKILGIRKFKITSELKELKLGFKSFPGISQIFMDVAKRLLPHDQFVKIDLEAKHVFAVRNNKKINPQKENDNDRYCYIRKSRTSGLPRSKLLLLSRGL